MSTSVPNVCQKHKSLALQVTALWDQHDRDRSGSLENEELKAMKTAAQTEHGIRADLFDSADADSNQKLTAVEAVTGMVDDFQRSCESPLTNG